jgi:hypothetical protein
MESYLLFMSQQAPDSEHGLAELVFSVTYFFDPSHVACHACYSPYSDDDRADTSKRQHYFNGR